MVKSSSGAKKREKRAPRSTKNMHRANQKADPKQCEKVRRKRPEQPTQTARRKRRNVQQYRASMTFDDWHRMYAIAAASERWRKIVRMSAKKKGKINFGRPSKIAFRPDNYEELLSLIPKANRSKPTAVGQSVIYVPHESTPCAGWTHAKVLSIHRHKDSNWIVVQKPLSVEEGANPYLAIDSTNVFVEPPKAVRTATWANAGVYVLYCAPLDKWYVGESGNIAKRIAEHEAHRGSKVTKDWPCFERMPLLTKHKRGERWEKWETREWDAVRKKFGYKNVRGSGSSQSQ